MIFPFMKFISSNWICFKNICMGTEGDTLSGPLANVIGVIKLCQY